MPESKDILFLLTPDFEDPAYPGQRFHCTQCTLVEGLLALYPDRARQLDVRRVPWPRPRQGVIALVGERNQSLPLLVLKEGATSPRQTGSHQGRAFISEIDAILLTLAERHDFAPPHP